MKPTEFPRIEKNVTYCDMEPDALELKALMLQSNLGNKSALDDVMKSLSGKVTGTVRGDNA